MADHMAAMLARARAASAASEAVTRDRRAADGFATRVQAAVLALMGAADLPGWLLHELPGLLQLDSVRLCAEGPDVPGATAIPPGTVAEALGGRRALVRDAAITPLLHGEAAALAGREALVCVPARAPALLALGCRDGAGLSGATTPVLAFLGQAVAIALSRT